MIFEFIRQLTCNFNEIEKSVPKSGKILDVGCGHGVFSKILFDASPKRQILGIDPSGKKIQLANKNYPTSRRLNFKKAYIYEVKTKFDAIIIIDVLYLLPYQEKVEFLKTARKKLVKHGKLILVINGKEPRWIYNILEVQEYIMTNILKITYTDFRKTYFEDLNSCKKILKEAGLKINKVQKIKSFLPYPHLLFIASPK